MSRYPQALAAAAAHPVGGRVSGRVQQGPRARKLIARLGKAKSWPKKGFAEPQPYACGYAQIVISCCAVYNIRIAEFGGSRPSRERSMRDL